MDKCSQGELKELPRCINVLEYINPRKMGCGDLPKLFKKTRIKTNLWVKNKIYHSDKFLLITVNWYSKRHVEYLTTWFK